MPELILGVDPGLVQTGWAIIALSNQRSAKQPVYLTSGVIKPASNLPLAARLLAIHDGLNQLITYHQPQYTAVEQTYVNKNSLSSIKLAEARAAALLSLALAALPVAEYQAKTIKKSVTGNGNADKEQVQRMLNYLFPETAIINHNQADALAVALCHSYHITSTLSNK